MLYVSKSYYLNEIGGREQNEDSVWPLEGAFTKEDKLFMVCDGVGGNSHGEVASALTCEGFADYFQKHLKPGTALDCEFINDARLYVMQEFEQYITSHASAENMSTTLTLAYIAEKSVLVAWCGDSRIYQIRNGTVIFQSEDHSTVNMLVKTGDITKEEAKTHPQRNEILRAIQYNGSPSKIDCLELTDVQNGDYILLCSDGLLENIDEPELKYLLTEIPEDLLITEFQNICQGKTRDNYSMYLLQLSGMPLAKKARERKKKFLAIIVLCLTIIAASLASWKFLTLRQSKVDSHTNSPISKPVERKKSELNVAAKQKQADSIKARQVADSTIEQNKKMDSLFNRHNTARKLTNRLDSSFKNKHFKQIIRDTTMPDHKFNGNASTQKIPITGSKSKKVINANGDTNWRQGTKPKTDTSKQDH